MPILNLPDCVNARDLQGLRLAPGSVVTKGALLRSDNLDLLSPAGIDALKTLSVVRILVLRFEWEARKYPGPFSEHPIYVNVPLIGEREDFDPDAPIDYRPEIDQYPGLIAAALTAFADAPAGAVLAHCHAGRDRTGMFIAFALAVAGASADEIIADYVTQ